MQLVINYQFILKVAFIAVKYQIIKEFITANYSHCHTARTTRSLRRTMEATGQSYSFYFIREYLPPMILFTLCIALSFLLIPVQLLLNRCPKLKRFFKTQFLIKQVFNTLLNKHRDKNGKIIYIIMSYKVPGRYKVMMLAMALSMLGAGGVRYWDIYLFEETFICSSDPNFACFPAYPNLSTPCLDCSDTRYLEDNNITSVICYRYVYRLGQATGGAPGIITTIVLYIIIITVLLLKVSNGNGSSKCRAVLTVAIQITIVVIILLVVASSSFLPAPIPSTNEKQIITNIASGSFHYTILYSTVLFPWWSFKKINDKDNNKKEESNGEYRRVRGTSIPI